ncbi:MAG: hypothetical protein WCJ30_28225 [Deltaproteobacteria bacterium]
MSDCLVARTARAMLCTVVEDATMRDRNHGLKALFLVFAATAGCALGNPEGTEADSGRGVTVDTYSPRDSGAVTDSGSAADASRDAGTSDSAARDAGTSDSAARDAAAGDDAHDVVIPTDTNDAGRVTDGGSSTDSGAVDCSGRDPATPLTACGDVCVSLSTDATNCGACGNVCPAGATCTGGRCSARPLDCASPYVNCSGVCIDPASDPANCGACGHACTSGQNCVGATCVAAGGAPCASTGDCGDEQYCQLDARTCAGPGRCVFATSPSCATVPPTVPAPVCGCDGITYPSECAAATAGMTVHSTGACTAIGS